MSDDDETTDGVVVPMRGLVEPPGWVPDFPTQRPPFSPGHELSLKHGAWSPRKVEPLAMEMVERVLDQASATGSPTAYLADPTYLPTVWAWGRTEARIQLVSEWLLERGSELDKDGDALGASRLLNRLEARAESLRARLGLDPLSRARLGRDVAIGGLSLAQLMAEESRRMAKEEADGADR